MRRIAIVNLSTRILFVILMGFLFTFVLPRVIGAFIEQKLSLPAPLGLLFNCGALVQRWWFVLFVPAIGLLVLDWFICTWLERRSRSAAWTWVAVTGSTLLLICVAAWFIAVMPYRELTS